MDRQLDHYRETVNQILLHHTEDTPSHGEIETRPVFDDLHNNYLLLDVGWDRTVGVLDCRNL